MMDSSILLVSSSTNEKYLVIVPRDFMEIQLIDIIASLV